MTRTIVGVALGGLLAALVLPASARAQVAGLGMMPEMQAPTGGVVSGHGTVVVKKPPTMARMHLALSGKGKTIEDALADLKAKRAKAVAFLEELGADKKSIEPGTPTVSREDAQRRRELERMIRQKMRGGKGGKPVKLPETVTVVAVLTAAWPLKAADPEAAFVTVHKLQQQIKAAKLAGGKEEGKLSPEEEELAEEAGSDMEAMFSRYGEEQTDPNAPVFDYVATIPDAERDKAMAEAFRKAKADAARLAQAAGAQLGALAGVSGAATNGSTGDGGPYGDYRSGPLRELLMRSMSSMEQETKAQEATGSDPGHVSFVFAVTANFALEKETDKPKAIKEK